MKKKAFELVFGFLIFVLAQALAGPPPGFVIDSGYDASGSFVEELVPLPPGVDAAAFVSSFRQALPLEVVALLAPDVPLVEFSARPLDERGATITLGFAFRSFSDFPLAFRIAGDRVARRSGDQLRRRAMVAEAGEVALTPEDLAAIRELRQRAEAAEQPSFLSTNTGRVTAGAVILGGLWLVTEALDGGGGNNNVSVQGDNNNVGAGGDQNTGGLGNNPAPVAPAPVAPAPAL